MSAPILFASKTPPTVIGKPEGRMMDLVVRSCVLSAFISFGDTLKNGKQI
jgi:ribonucleotide monophosphatase NagD (HAD superfamily)